MKYEKIKLEFLVFSIKDRIVNLPDESEEKQFLENALKNMDAIDIIVKNIDFWLEEKSK